MSPNRLSKLTIVLVDDNPDVRRHVSAYLSHLGIKVAVADNAIEGLEAVKSYRPNLNRGGSPARRENETESSRPIMKRFLLR